MRLWYDLHHRRRITGRLLRQLTLWLHQMLLLLQHESLLHLTRGRRPLLQLLHHLIIRVLRPRAIRGNSLGMVRGITIRGSRRTIQDGTAVKASARGMGSGPLHVGTQSRLGRVRGRMLSRQAGSKLSRVGVGGSMRKRLRRLLSKDLLTGEWTIHQPLRLMLRLLKRLRRLIARSK